MPGEEARGESPGRSEDDDRDVRGGAPSLRPQHHLLRPNARLLRTEKRAHEIWSKGPRRGGAAVTGNRSGGEQKDKGGTGREFSTRARNSTHTSMGRELAVDGASLFLVASVNYS